ncbi:hypothetical protein ECC41_03555 [Helicobacter pylori]|nr:hypothetical protein ECC41_03555 [Helicobacter pylori]
MNHFKNLTLSLKSTQKNILFFILFKKYSKHFLQLKRSCKKQAITSLKALFRGFLVVGCREELFLKYPYLIKKMSLKIKLKK